VLAADRRRQGPEFGLLRRRVEHRVRVFAGHFTSLPVRFAFAEKCE
jgi:hypothetical protein